VPNLTLNGDRHTPGTAERRADGAVGNDGGLTAGGEGRGCLQGAVIF
jgi:hypothetical protein